MTLGGVSSGHVQRSPSFVGRTRWQHWTLRMETCVPVLGTVSSGTSLSPSSVRDGSGSRDMTVRRCPSGMSLPQIGTSSHRRRSLIIRVTASETVVGKPGHGASLLKSFRSLHPAIASSGLAEAVERLPRPNANAPGPVNTCTQHLAGLNVKGPMQFHRNQ